VLKFLLARLEFVNDYLVIGEHVADLEHRLLSLQPLHHGLVQLILKQLRPFLLLFRFIICLAYLRPHRTHELRVDGLNQLAYLIPGVRMPRLEFDAPRLQCLRHLVLLLAARSDPAADRERQVNLADLGCRSRHLLGES
jgi:hypothetical protein